MKNVFLGLLIGGLLLVVSCKSKDNINYMKNIEDSALEAYNQNFKSTIQSGDQLIIMVSAKDMDVVKPFNQAFSSAEVSQFSLPNTNLPMQPQNNSTGPMYTVDSEGMIDFPVLGLISTKDKTVEMLRDEIKTKVSRYVKAPSVNVNTTNFKITILGDVNRPGYYTIPDGKPTTILSALGMAGDLTIYGNREDILLIRNVDGKISKEYINLTDAKTISSPYYYVKQNDVIYISSNKAKQVSSKFGPQTGIYISIASIIVTILALVIKK